MERNVQTDKYALICMRSCEQCTKGCVW